MPLLAVSLSVVGLLLYIPIQSYLVTTNHFRDKSQRIIVENANETIAQLNTFFMINTCQKCRNSSLISTVQMSMKYLVSSRSFTDIHIKCTVLIGCSRWVCFKQVLLQCMVQISCQNWRISILLFILTGFLTFSQVSPPSNWFKDPFSLSKCSDSEILISTYQITTFISILVDL